MASTDSKLYPFFLVEEKASGSLEELVEKYSSKLISGGYSKIGQHSYFDGSMILLIFTSEELQKIAQETKRGGYGAVFRLTLTSVDGVVQVLAVSLDWWGACYRMSPKMMEIDRSLKHLLIGETQPVYIGCAKGKKEQSLRKYQYTFGMPDFNDPLKLIKHASREAAAATIEKNLEAKVGGVSKIYRIDLQSSNQTVFGVAMDVSKENEYSDEVILKLIDLDPIKHSAHLPWEILVTEDGRVETLSAKFRIAISFPDLPMAGHHSFASIMSCPGSIEKALKRGSA